MGPSHLPSSIQAFGTAVPRAQARTVIDLVILGPSNSLMQPIFKHRFLAFLVLSVLFRIGTFFPLVIDHDESTYIIMADQWLQGHLPYVDFIDVKPIGVYLWFALVLKICSSVAAVRLTGVLFLACTAYWLSLTHDRLFQRKWGIYVGCLYLFLASLHKWSWPVNTEILFGACTAFALFILTWKRQNIGTFALFGLVLGIGFLCKYHIVFDLLALVVFSLSLGRNNLYRWFWRMVIAAFSFSMPFLITAAYYHLKGYWTEFYTATYIIPKNYASSASTLEQLKFVGEFYLSFLPFSLAFFAGIFYSFKYRTLDRTLLSFLALWTLTSWVGALITGKGYFHYYFQPLMPFCFFLPPLAKAIRHKYFFWMLTMVKKYRVELLLTAVLVTNGNQISYFMKRPTYLQDAAEIVKKNVEPGEVIYTNHENLLYFLSATTPPSKYIHTSILYKPDLARAYMVDLESEWEHIISQHPKYVLLKSPIPTTLEDFIRSKYISIKEYSDVIVLYKRAGNPNRL